MIEVPTLVDDCTRNEILIPAVKRAIGGEVFVECGVWLGGNICRIGQAIKEMGVAIDLYAIDMWICDDISAQGKAGIEGQDYHKIFMENINKCDVQDVVIPIREDSIKAAQLFKDQSIDLLFLDSCHSYPYVDLEIKAWLPNMKKGGILVGHDYKSSEGIRMAVRENFGDKINVTSDGGSSYWVKI